MEAKNKEIALRILSSSDKPDYLVAYVPNLNHYTAKQLLKILKHHPEKTELMHLLRAQCLKEPHVQQHVQK